MKQIIVSIHIPKTAGVTLKNILNGVYGERFLWFTETNSPRVTFERLRGYNLDDIDCIHGHIGYGIHRYLNLLGIGCKYITFTRSIANRLLSYYNYINTDAVREHYKWDDRFGWDKDMGFAEWLSSCKMADQDNSMVRFLSGCENLNTDPIKYRMCLTDCNIASQNSTGFSFIGAMESFDNDIINLANKLSWDNIPEYGKDNAHPDHLYEKDLTSEELKLISESQEFDIYLMDGIRNKEARMRINR